MTTIAPAVADSAAPARSAASRFADHRLTLGHVIRSEWIKLTTLRSTWWSAACVLLIAVGISGLAGVAMLLSDFVTTEAVAAMTLSFTTMPVMFIGLLATVMGSMFITGEYSTGMIRSTLTTAPDRTRSFLGKTIVLAGFIFVLSLVASALSYAVVAVIFAVGGFAADLSDPGAALLPYVWAALYMVALALMGLGIGYIVRVGAGAIAIAAGIVFVLPIIAQILGMAPGMQWVLEASMYLPLNAGATLVQGGEDEVGAGIALALFAVVPLLTGYGLLRARDA